MSHDLSTIEGAEAMVADKLLGELARLYRELGRFPPTFILICKLDPVTGKMNDDGEPFLTILHFDGSQGCRTLFWQSGRRRSVVRHLGSSPPTGL